MTVLLLFQTFAKYDVRFMKIEYELIDAEDPLVLVHYIGDETIWKPFRHGNSVRNDRPFVRTMKSAVKRRVLELGAVAPPREVYKTLLTSQGAVEPGYEAVTAPRNKEQVRKLCGLLVCFAITLQILSLLLDQKLFEICESKPISYGRWP